MINLTGGKSRHCNSTGIARLIADWMKVYQKRTGSVDNWEFHWGPKSPKKINVVADEYVGTEARVQSAGPRKGEL